MSWESWQSCCGSWCCRRGPGVELAGDQLAAQQLADRRFRNLGDEDIAARPLEVAQPGRAAELVQFILADRLAALDEGGDDLAPALVGKADHRHLRHRGMQRQTALDLDPRTALAAGDGHGANAARHEPGPG